MRRVYFFAGAELIKIGSSDNPEKRLAQIRSMCPVPLELIAHFDGDRDDEFDLHDRFKALWHHGEWFLDQTPIRDYVRECVKAGRLTWEGPRKMWRTYGVRVHLDPIHILPQDCVRIAAWSAIEVGSIKRLYARRSCDLLDGERKRIRNVAKALELPLPPEPS